MGDDPCHQDLNINKNQNYYNTSKSSTRLIIYIERKLINLLFNGTFSVFLIKLNIKIPDRSVEMGSYQNNKSVVME